MRWASSQIAAWRHSWTWCRFQCHTNTVAKARRLSIVPGGNRCSDDRLRLPVALDSVESPVSYMTPFVNFLLYQIGWFCCVLGAAWHSPWLGMSIALGLVAAHFWLATDRTTQLKLVLAAAGVGFIIDSSQLWIGAFVFPSGILVDWLPPPWMTVLWIQFATTFRYSMRWLSRRYALSAFFGFTGAPLAFFAGERLGAIQFLTPRLTHYALLALLWSVAVPLLVYVSDYLLARGQSSPGYRWPVGLGHAHGRAGSPQLRRVDSADMAE